MIDRMQFSLAWNRLEQHPVWGKRASEVARGEYYEILKGRLTPEQLEAVTTRLYAESGWFPTPDAFVALAPPAERRALPPLPPQERRDCVGCGREIWVADDTEKCLRCHLEDAGYPDVLSPK